MVNEKERGTVYYDDGYKINESEYHLVANLLIASLKEEKAEDILSIYEELVMSSVQLSTYGPDKAISEFLCSQNVNDERKAMLIGVMASWEMEILFDPIKDILVEFASGEKAGEKIGHMSTLCLYNGGNYSRVSILELCRKPVENTGNVENIKNTVRLIQNKY